MEWVSFGVFRVNNYTRLARNRIGNIHFARNKISCKHLLRGCLHKISFLAKWNIVNSVSGQSLITVYMKYLEMKLIVRVISLRLFRQKLNLMSGDKCYQSTTPKSNHLEGNICACVYFIKTKVIDQQIKNRANLFYFFRNEN